MNKKKIFLSRVTGEFDRLVKKIRETANQAYPMLELHSQDHPPPVKENQVTVKNLYKWIEASDHVFLYVGTEPGSSAKTPGDQDLSGCLDPGSLDIIKTLKEKYKFQEKDLTYTIIEGVIAFGLRKEISVFILKPRGKCLPLSLQKYRAWLKHELQGRNRIEADSAEQVEKSSFETLQNLHTDYQRERRLMGIGDRSLWETVHLMVSPGTEPQDINEWADGILKYSGDSGIDWITEAHRCAEGAPHHVSKYLPSRENPQPTRTWFAPAATPDGSNTLIAFSNADPLDLWTAPLELGGWSLVSFYFKGPKSLWCLLHKLDEGWSLNLFDGAASKNSQPLKAKKAFPLKGKDNAKLQGLGYGKKLLLSDNHFYISCPNGQTAYRVEFDCKEKCFRLGQNQIPEKTTSTDVPAFAQNHALPFRRGFKGQVYETYDPERDPGAPWALVKAPDAPGVGASPLDAVYFLSFRRGSFLDAFKIIDVEIEGVWKICDIGQCGAPPRGIKANLQLENSSSRATIHLPLFQVSQCKIGWGIHEYTASTTPKIFKPTEWRDTMSICAVKPSIQCQFEPFCYFERSVVQKDGDETSKSTKFKVWLIPLSKPNQNPSTLLSNLNNLLTGLKPLPHSFREKHDAVSADGANNIGSDFEKFLADTKNEWWKKLWEHPFT